MEKCFKLTIGFITLLASISLLGAIFFYLWELKNLQIVLITILAPVITWLIWLHLIPSSQPQGISKFFTIVQNLLKLKFKIWQLIKDIKKIKTKENLISNIVHWSLIATYLLITTKVFLFLFNFQTNDPIRSPWEAIPSEFFIIYFILTLLLLIIIFFNKKSYQLPVTGYLFLISIHFFLTYSIVIIIYQINFGFDPFIHQATEKILLTTGSISPKPLLYVGQYSLVVWFSKIFNISLITIDKLLVPLLTSLLLPAILFFSLTKGFGFRTKTAFLTILTFPIFLLPFYFTVPQNLANLFLLITVLLSLVSLRGRKRSEVTKQSSGHEIAAPQLASGLVMTSRVKLLLYLLGLTTLVIHTFSGILLIIYLIFITFFTQTKLVLNRKHKIILLIILILISIAALPTALSIGSKISENINVSFTNYQLPVTSYQFAKWIPFYSIYHLIYFFKTNHILILGLLAAAGLWLLFKNKKLLITNYQLLVSLIITFLIISINISILKLIKLPIISYELPEFIARFWQIGLLFLAPIIMYAIGKVISVILEKRAERATIGSQDSMAPAKSSGLQNDSTVYESWVANCALLFFIALFSTISLYLTYPRRDAFTTGRAYATSASDIKAVQWIENDAKGKEYIVLADQAVSAAAIQEFGFKKYYSVCHPGGSEATDRISDNPQDSIGLTTDASSQTLQNDNLQLFYYPIPTTSPLYQLYLEMVYQEPTKNRLNEALEITGAKIGYFVINNYWLDFEKIVTKSKQEFSEFTSIDNQKIYIFKLSHLN